MSYKASTIGKFEESCAAPYKVKNPCSAFVMIILKSNIELVEEYLYLTDPLKEYEDKSIISPELYLAIKGIFRVSPFV